MKYKICYHCNGVGLVPDGYVFKPITECPTCNGEGKIIIQEEVKE